ncbi:MAG TPA: bifunctional adenosylcobinamide kinase/adenosylcobinamide-phosphate guanylyltransferase [Candidatus Humimicrobiaceae bacterium]
MGRIYFLLGGARSGKSDYSENLASSLSEKVAYVATAEIIDEEMKKRIELHRSRRPAGWQTFEFKESNISIDDFNPVLETIISQQNEVILIDCITNLLFRIVYKHRVEDLEIIDNVFEKKIEEEALEFFEQFLSGLTAASDKHNLNIILVSNEVGLGLVPPYPFGRIFRDLLGLVNKKIASVSDEVYFFVAGLKMQMK